MDLTLDPDGYVLSRDALGAEPRRPDRLGREIREVGVSIGVKASLHRLRHYTASHLVAQNLDVAPMASRMRHRDKALTMRTYVHDDGTNALRAADILGRSLGEPKAD